MTTSTAKPENAHADVPKRNKIGMPIRYHMQDLPATVVPVKDMTGRRFAVYTRLYGYEDDYGERITKPFVYPWEVSVWHTDNEAGISLLSMRTRDFVRYAVRRVVCNNGRAFAYPNVARVLFAENEPEGIMLHVRGGGDAYFHYTGDVNILGVIVVYSPVAGGLPLVSIVVQPTDGE